MRSRKGWGGAIAFLVCLCLAVLAVNAAQTWNAGLAGGSDRQVASEDDNSCSTNKPPDNAE